MNSEFCRRNGKNCLHLKKANDMNYFCNLREFKLYVVTEIYIKPINNLSCQKFELKERGLNYTNNALRYDGNKRC